MADSKPADTGRLTNVKEAPEKPNVKPETNKIEKNLETVAAAAEKPRNNQIGVIENHAGLAGQSKRSRKNFLKKSKRHKKAFEKRNVGVGASSTYNNNGPKPEQTEHRHSFEKTVLVKVQGGRVPAPINKFEEIKFDEALKKNMIKWKYEHPTLVQKYSLPIIMADRDLIACAQTGSGKTAAYMLPILQKLIENSQKMQHKADDRQVLALILVPTRDLVQQLLDEILKLTAGTRIKPLSVFGNFWSEDRECCKRMCCDLLVATPKRLLDSLQRNMLELQYIRYVVIDEADAMIWSKTNIMIREMFNYPGMPKKTERCTVMFSATFPETVQDIAKSQLCNPLTLIIGRQGGSVPENIKQTVLWVNEKNKREKLLSLLPEVYRRNRSKLTLVYIRSKAGASATHKFLKKHNIDVAILHSDMSAFDLDSTLERFRQGNKTVLIVSDVCERGLNVPNVRLVINYDMPWKITDYVHRVGRTGRMGKEGHAITFFNAYDGKVRRFLMGILEETKQNVPAFLTAEGYSNMKHPNRRFQANREKQKTKTSNDEVKTNDAQLKKQNGKATNANDTKPPAVGAAATRTKEPNDKNRDNSSNLYKKDQNAAPNDRKYSEVVSGNGEHNAVQQLRESSRSDERNASRNIKSRGSNERAQSSHSAARVSRSREASVSNTRQRVNLAEPKMSAQYRSISARANNAVKELGCGINSSDNGSAQLKVNNAETTKDSNLTKFKSEETLSDQREIHATSSERTSTLKRDAASIHREGHTICSKELLHPLQQESKKLQKSNKHATNHKRPLSMQASGMLHNSIRSARSVSSLYENGPVNNASVDFYQSINRFRVNLDSRVPQAGVSQHGHFVNNYGTRVQTHSDDTNPFRRPKMNGNVTETRISREQNVKAPYSSLLLPNNPSSALYQNARSTSGAVYTDNFAMQNNYGNGQFKTRHDQNNNNNYGNSGNNGAMKLYSDAYAGNAFGRNFGVRKAPPTATPYPATFNRGDTGPGLVNVPKQLPEPMQQPMSQAMPQSMPQPRMQPLSHFKPQHMPNDAHMKIAVNKLSMQNDCSSEMHLENQQQEMPIVQKQLKATASSFSMPSTSTSMLRTDMECHITNNVAYADDETQFVYLMQPESNIDPPTKPYYNVTPLRTYNNGCVDMSKYNFIPDDPERFKNHRATIDSNEPIWYNYEDVPKSIFCDHCNATHTCYCEPSNLGDRQKI